MSTLSTIPINIIPKPRSELSLPNSNSADKAESELARIEGMERDGVSHAARKQTPVSLPKGINPFHKEVVLMNKMQ